MIKLNESKHYTVSENDYKSVSDFKKMKIGSEISMYNFYARKIGNDQWEVNDRIETFKISSSGLADHLEDEEYEVDEA